MRASSWEPSAFPWAWLYVPTTVLQLAMSFERLTKPCIARNARGVTVFPFGLQDRHSSRQGVSLVSLGKSLTGCDIPKFISDDDQIEGPSTRHYVKMCVIG